MTYMSPTSVEDALGVLSSGGVSILAGGTDWFPVQGEAPITRPILDLRNVAEFRGIDRFDGGWRIGAMTTWTEIAQADLPPMFAGLARAARAVGSVQIQNVATVAGNICNASPAADGVPALLSLAAQIEIVSQAGRRVLPLEEFITGVRKTALRPGELVSAIIVPKFTDKGVTAGSGDIRGGFIKLGTRHYLVISIAMVAVVLCVENGRILAARVAVGSCGPVAVRLRALEAALVGCGADEIEAVAEGEMFAELSPISDVRGSGEYRQEAARELCIRAIVETLEGAKK